MIVCLSNWIRCSWTETSLSLVLAEVVSQSATEEESFLGQPPSSGWDASPGSTPGSVMGRRKGLWEKAWLGVATLSCSQSFLSVPSSACTVQHSWITQVPYMSMGLHGEGANSSIALTSQHHIKCSIITAPSRPSSVALRGGLALEIRSQPWHMQQALGLKQMLILTLMFHPTL